MVARSGGGSDGSSRQVETIRAVVRRHNKTTCRVKGEADERGGGEHPNRCAVLVDTIDAADPSQRLNDIEMAVCVEGQA